jgi:hypothetical protein
MANYDHPADGPRGLHYAMEYNNLGQPIVRVTDGSGQYNSQGNLNTRTDSFGRTRISEPFTLFDNTFRYTDNTLEWSTATATGGTVSHLDTESSIAMAVTADSGSSVIRETKRIFQYQPGKSLQIMNTFVMSATKSGLRQRVGYFDARNGVFLEQNGSVTSIVKRSYVSSAVEDTQIAQGDWNVDTLDGKGPSGLYLDLEKVQIFWTDVEWLGAGSVRTGFVINGQFIVCHVFHHANLIGSVYMTTASLPVRYEITNTTATSGVSEMKQICSTVISEGGYTPKTIPRSISTALAGVNLSNTVFRPLVAIRLRSDRTEGIAVPAMADLYGLQGNPFIFKMTQNATITTGTWVSVGAESHVEYNITATDTINTGTDLIRGTFLGSGVGNAGSVRNVDVRDFNHSLQLRRRLDGTREIFVLACQATSNNDDAVGVLTWQEDN